MLYPETITTNNAMLATLVSKRSISDTTKAVINLCYCTTWDYWLALFKWVGIGIPITIYDTYDDDVNDDDVDDDDVN